MRNIGLRAKVAVFVSCLMVAVVSINAVITISAERHEQESQLIERGRLFARLTATDVVRTYGSSTMGAGGRDTDGLDKRMARFFGYYPDLDRLTVISENGLVLYDSGAGASQADRARHTEDASLMARLKLAETDVRESTGPGGEKLMDILAPVTEGGGPQFIKVRYIISYRSLEARVSDIRREFLLLAGFFIAAGIAAAMVFSAKLTRPILTLKEGAVEIARGNLSHTVPVSGADEIGELGRSFNAMALSLKEHRKSIEEANISLVAANEELKDLQGELVRSERMAAVGQLAAGLSHEIDNPIGVILGFAELLLEDMRADDPRREDVVTIIEESKRCKRIVRGLLDFSRPPVLGVVQTDVNEVVRRTVDAARLQRVFRVVRVELDLAGEVPVMQADPDRLKQVFMNLLLNAVQAMPEGGDIHIATRYEENTGTVKVLFRDTGAGISPADMPRIFDPFFSTKRPGEGTGLGLAICVRLLEEQGGKIEVESEPGRGSVFTVTLPINGPPEPGAPENA